MNALRQAKLSLTRLTLALLLGVVSLDGIAGGVWLPVGKPVPLGGGVFETPLVFTTFDAIVGAYEIRLQYDPAVLEILEISVPADSPFLGSTFFDSDSFASGYTLITAFQVQVSGASTPSVKAVVVRWSAPTGIWDFFTRIDVRLLGLVEAGWRPVEVETYGYDYVDTDGDDDELTNLDEFEIGTDPRNSDTDGDRVTDGRDPNPLDRMIPIPTEALPSRGGWRVILQR